MQGVSQSRNKTESPKTPGGISKSLLTPCRRVGLSKKWNRGGSSPFVSPLSTHNSSSDRKDDKQIRKRKTCDDSGILSENNEPLVEHHDAIDANLDTPQSCKKYNETYDITKTPSRNTQISRKVFKNLASSLEIDQIDNIKDSSNSIITKHLIVNEEENVFKNNSQMSKENVSKPHRTKSKIKNGLSPKNNSSRTEYNSELMCGDTMPKDKSPNNLIKECMVVIESKILNADKQQIRSKFRKHSDESDSESDVPLSIFQKDTVTLNTLNDHNFIPNSAKEMNRIKSLEESRSSQEDMDKRTILIKKSYEKVTKPLKAKSTGSITQRDIEDLTAQIERKKKLLLAKAMSTDTEELRNLIKKWQKGCQDALVELLDLMKRKLPDQRNMEYAEILQSLRIPAELVGYDAENDCFITPDDTNVLLSAFKL